MPITHSAKIEMNLELKSIIADGINAGIIPAKILEKLELRGGIADGQIDKGFSITESAKPASGTTTYDLTSLSFYGSSIVFDEIVLIAIRNKRTTAGAYLNVGPNAANGFGDTGPWADASDRSQVGPSGWFVMYNPTGWPVDGTHKSLDVTTSAVAGAINSWDILILGRSA
jgi:hypothetical protein